MKLNAPYPTCAIPKIMNDAGCDIGMKFKCPDELTAQQMQAVVSAAVQSVIQVQVPVYGLSSSNLNFLTLASSGEGKNSVQSESSKGLCRFINELAERDDVAIANYQANIDIWRAENEGIRRKLQRLASTGENLDEIKELANRHHLAKPVVPMSHRFILEEFDKKSLVEILATRSKFVFVDSAEAASILNRQFVKNANLIVRLYSGEQITMSWSGSRLKDFSVMGALATFNLMVQPKPFSEFLADSKDDLINSGLLPRFLPAYPISQRGRRFISEGQAYNSAGIDAFNERIYEVLNHAPYYKNRSEEKITLVLSDRTRRMWFDVRNAIEAAMAPGAQLFEVPEFASRLANNMLRMAANWQFFQHGNAEISVETFLGALEVCRWHATEFVRMFSEEAQAPEPENDANVVEACLWKWYTERLEYSWAFDHMRPRVPRPIRGVTTRLRAALEVLVSQGRLFLVQTVAGTYYQLNLNYTPIQAPQRPLIR